MGTCLSRIHHTESPDEDAGLACPGLPIQEPTQSFWTYPPSSIAAHVSQNTPPPYADVVIIGSGISGASFARTLLGMDQQRDISEGKPLTVVMLEAHETCSGASGRNGGHINPGLYDDYEDLRNRFGVRAARNMIHFRLAHLEILRSVGELEAPDADCREVEAVDVYYDEETFSEAKRLLKVYKAEMPEEAEPYECTEGEEARTKYNLSKEALGCITTRAGAVHPYLFVTGVLTRLLEDYPKHFHLYTRTPCTSITGPSTNNPLYRLHTPRGVISASHVVHLTNAYIGTLIPGLSQVVARMRETMSAQRPGSALQLKMPCGERSYVFYDNPSKKSFDYLTQLRSGELMFGCGLEGDVDAGSSGMYDLHSAALVSGALPVYFGAANWGAEAVDAPPESNSELAQEPWAKGRVKALWSGELSVSADGFPWVGRVPPSICGRAAPRLLDYNPRMARPAEWVAAGYSGEGMVHAWLCARAVALMVLGMDDRRDIETEVVFGAGQSVKEWLPTCFIISEARLKRLSQDQKYREVSGSKGKVYNTKSHAFRSRTKDLFAFR
ncbi:FAD dependent oxidoreductase-domain-containing protein [Scleroderma yunnanense]